MQIDLSEAGIRALLDEAKSAALAGWSGKQVIHPKQVCPQRLTAAHGMCGGIVTNGCMAACSVNGTLWCARVRSGDWLS
jgi:hypothetical protein